MLGNKHTLGKSHSIETRKKMSQSRLGNKNRLGTFPTSETRSRLSEAQRRAWAKRKELAQISQH